jgi:hypothetical protein
LFVEACPESGATGAMPTRLSYGPASIWHNPLFDLNIIIEGIDVSRYSQNP